jgi:hypothetical protein
MVHNIITATEAAAGLAIYSGKPLSQHPVLHHQTIQELTHLLQAAAAEVLLREAAAVDQVLLQTGRQEVGKKAKPRPPYPSASLRRGKLLRL